MSKDKKTTTSVQGTTIIILSQREDDYIPLTDMLKFRRVYKRSASTNSFVNGVAA